MASLFRRSNGIYYAVFCVNGKRICRSTDTADLEAAKLALIDLSREFGPQGLSKLKFSEFKEQYLPYARTNLAPGTVLLYDGALRAFVLDLLTGTCARASFGGLLPESPTRRKAE